MSLAQVHTPIRHPDLTTPGLSASLVEAVSMSFDSGVPQRTLVTGEVALAYNRPSGVTGPTAQILRLENFAALEKVAPNPAFVSAVLDHAGEYTLNSSNLTRTAVAFKYQVHVEDSAALSFAPLIVTPVWRIEANQASVIVHWKPNPALRHSAAGGVLTLRNVTVVTGIDGAGASACQSKPVGIFSREKARLGWKLGDLTLDAAAAEGGKLLARFTTEAQARSTPVELRWEISGDEAEGAGSGLAIAYKEDASEDAPAPDEEEEEDPFADAEEKSTGEKSAEEKERWEKVTTVKRVQAGKYVAV